MGPRLSLGGTDSRFVDSSSSRERAFRGEAFRGGGGSNGSKSVVNTLIKKRSYLVGERFWGLKGVLEVVEECLQVFVRESVVEVLSVRPSQQMHKCVYIHTIL